MLYCKKTRDSFRVSRKKIVLILLIEREEAY